MIFQIWNLPTFRDIKGANIFLTDDMKNLKLGDYGSAVKIKQHTTMPGELQGHVGTQGGHGPLPQNAKISDINSENCCVNATHEVRATYSQGQIFRLTLRISTLFIMILQGRQGPKSAEQQFHYFFRSVLQTI